MHKPKIQKTDNSIDNMLNNKVICTHCGYQLVKTTHYCYYHWDSGVYSDMRDSAPDVIVPSIVQLCPHCGKYFVQDNEFMIIENSSQVNYIDPVEYPALKDGFKSYDTLQWNETQEYNQRLRFMWAYNDYFYHYNDGTHVPTKEDVGNFLLNVERLELFLHPIQYAELLREAGEFELCISRLKTSLPQMDEDEKRFAEHVIKLAEQGKKAPFCLRDMFESEESE